MMITSRGKEFLKGFVPLGALFICMVICMVIFSDFTLKIVHKVKDVVFWWTKCFQENGMLLTIRNENFFKLILSHEVLDKAPEIAVPRHYNCFLIIRKFDHTVQNQLGIDVSFYRSIL